MNKPVACALLVGLYSLLMTACVNLKKATYFNNLGDSSKIPLAQIVPPQQKIQVNDLIEAKVGGENEKATMYINQYLAGANAAGGGLQSTVDIDGNIELPVIGKLKVSGLTRDEAKKVITEAYSIYLKNPVVSVRFLNFRFTVLGEVKTPGNFNSTNDKVNLFEAIAYAGDMTQYAKREVVKIIRETDSKREVISLDFNDKSILNSPYYYINRSDIIYVESQKGRFFSDNFSRTAAIVGSGSGLLAFLLTILRN